MIVNGEKEGWQHVYILSKRKRKLVEVGVCARARACA